MSLGVLRLAFLAGNLWIAWLYVDEMRTRRFVREFDGYLSNRE